MRTDIGLPIFKKNMARFFYFTLFLLWYNTRPLVAQNLALHKSYTVSVLPNYDYTAPSSNTSSLTDGIYTKQQFWTHKTTVGWKYRKSVEITIDLKKTQPIGAVSFNTASGVAGVHLPKHLYVFVGDDERHYKYIGDAAEEVNRKYGIYRVNKLTLKSINQEGRYVSIIAVADGPFIFCDEIEILKGLGKTQKVSQVEKDHALISVYSNLAQRINEKSNYHKYQDAIVRQHTKYLSDYFRSSFVVNKINPWIEISPIYTPPDLSKLVYSYRVPIKGIEYGAFVVTNCSNSAHDFFFNITLDNLEIVNIKLYEVPFVATRNGTKVADPLIPIESSVRIEPGLTKMFWFAITGKHAGEANAAIRISGNKESHMLEINTQVVNLHKDGKTIHSDLNANVWAYLYMPMINGVKDIATTDLNKHYVNTVVVPAWKIPTLTMARSDDFLKYLSYFKNTDNILLFINYNQYLPSHFLSNNWKAKFKKWYYNIIELLINNGYGHSRIYLYPYDEIKGKRNINRFKKLILWSKKEISEIRYFATFNDKEAINSLLPLVEIGQILDRKDLLQNLPKHNAKIWIYTIAAASRSLSSYKDFRLMAWRAYARGYAGIGFWNYADKQSKGLNFINGNLVDPIKNYSVVYNSPKKILLSSRRWEGFRLGMEDYQVVKLYEQYFGRGRTLNLVNTVLNNPSDDSKAEQVKEEMIEQIELQNL